MKDLRTLLEPHRERLFEANRWDPGKWRLGGTGRVTLHLTNDEAREVLGAPERRPAPDRGRATFEATGQSRPWDELDPVQRQSWAELEEAVERRLAAVIAAYYEQEIRRLMQQADHWRAGGDEASPDFKPGAVHHRVCKADAYFQVVAQMERFARHGENPFREMRDAIERGPMKTLGTYPPSPEVHAFRDPTFVAEALARAAAARAAVKASTPAPVNS